MAIVVQKYGGSSVADAERIRGVAARVAARKRQGDDVVVVVSAMGDTTDELLALSRAITHSPPRRELDMLLTAGERISMALLSMALNADGIEAISFTGSQSGIITSESHTNARILEVRPHRIREELAKGKVVIVAGYQGVSRTHEVTTLGRGGSDTSAVALAAALSASACEIYSDVDGVFSSDPRVVEQAKKLAEISWEEMQELAEAGARVLNAQAVEFARRAGIAIDARSTFQEGGGTRIFGESPPTRRMVGVAGAEEVMMSVRGVTPETFEEVGEFLEARGVAGRWISCTEVDATATLFLSLENLHDRDAFETACRAVMPDVRFEKVGVVSAIGAGLGADSRALTRGLKALGRVSGAFTSPSRISFVLPEEELRNGMRQVHEALKDWMA